MINNLTQYQGKKGLVMQKLFAKHMKLIQNKQGTKSRKHILEKGEETEETWRRIAVEVENQRESVEGENLKLSLLNPQQFSN